MVHETGIPSCPPTPPMKKVCLLYLDILGFSSFIDRHGYSEAFDIIHRAIWCATTFATRFNKIANESEIKYKGYSDNFVFYVELNEDKEDCIKCAWLLNLTAYLQEEFISVANVQIRGAVTIGECYIEDYIFGKAYVDAYTLESKRADWARVMLSEEVVEQIRPLLKFVPILDDGDGPYLDFLPLSINPENNESFREHIELLTEHFIMIYDEIKSEIIAAKTLGQIVELSKHLNRNNRMLHYIWNYRKSIGLESNISKLALSNSMYSLWTRFQASLSDLSEDNIERTKQKMTELVEAYQLTVTHLDKTRFRHPS